jgi:hypothetical protein
MGIEKKIDSDDTKLYVKLNCASGIIEPMLNRPLWQMHTYMGVDGRKELYCPMHQEVYDKIKARERLDALDGSD